MKPKPDLRIVGSFVLVVALFAAILAVMGHVIVQNRDLARQGKTAHDALCVVRARDRDDITRLQAFIHDHPDGIDGLATRAQLDAQLARDRSDLLALSDLRCTDVPIPSKLTTTTS